MFGLRPFGVSPFGVMPGPDTAHIAIVGRGELTVTARYEIFVATREFITGLGDTPESQPFAGVLNQPLNFSRSILGGSGIATFATGGGEMIIQNSGDYDFLPESYTLDGRDQEIRIGRDDIPFSDWFTIFKGVATSMHVDEAALRIDLADYAYKLDVPLQTSTYAGTGGIEGGEDLNGKRKPRAFGPTRNVTPTLLSANAQLYQVNDGPVEAIPAVYANGAALSVGTDHADSATLLAASVTSGYFDTCIAEGMFRANYLLDGDVLTCDVEGDKTGGVYVETIGQIVRRIVSTSTALIDPSDLYLPSFDAFELASPYVAGFYASHNDDLTVSEALARFIGYGNYFGFRRNGKMEIVRFEAPDGPPAMRFARTDILDLRRERLPDGLAPPPWRWRVGYGRNWTVQDDVAGSVSDTTRAFLAEQQRFAVAQSQNTKTNHPFAQEREIGGYLRDEADAEAEASRMLALHSTSASLYRIQLDTRPFALDLGDVVEITFPRFDLTDGRLLRIVSLNENGEENWVEILGFG